jgi:prevent-host-death family protein
MKYIGAYEAKTHLSALLEEVSKGERITITKHGRPIAVLQPPASVLQKSRNEVIDDLIHFARSKGTGGIPLKDLINEGRRR